LRPPPSWPATAAMFPPATTPRPRPLFFASNRPLPGLPQKLVPFVHELPGPFPSLALADFPSEGVLLWIAEEAKGEPSPQFPVGCKNSDAPRESATLQRDRVWAPYGHARRFF
jgi:hypothetical protein